MAEWLCSGLQSRLRRFDSGFSLHKRLTIDFAQVVELVDTRDLKSLEGNFVPVQVRLWAPIINVNDRIEYLLPTIENTNEEL